MSVERRPAQFTLEEVTRLAREVALEHGGHIPTLIAQGTRGAALGQLEALPETHEARRSWMFAAGMTLAQSSQVGELKQVFLVTEGWMSVAKEDGTIEVPPSQDPNRKEVLSVSRLEVGERRTDLVLFEMVRDGEDQLAELKRLEQPAGEDGAYAESPLLAAFVNGFRMGMQRGVN